ETSPCATIRTLLDQGLETPENGLDYTAVAEGARVLAGARFAVYNAVIAQGSRTVTRAIVGSSETIKEAVSLLGRRLVGASYTMDPTILEAMEAGASASLIPGRS
ncbi:MAG: hypothetical protein ACLFNP_09045, partial [Spirochaetaceae bacterium]